MGGEHEVALAAAYRYDPDEGLRGAEVRAAFPGLEFEDGVYRLGATRGVHVSEEALMPRVHTASPEAFPACIERAIQEAAVDESSMLAFCLDGGDAWMRVGVTPEEAAHPSVWVSLHLPMETRPLSAGVPDELLPRAKRTRHADVFTFPLPGEHGEGAAYEAVDAEGAPCGSGRIVAREDGELAWSAYGADGVLASAGREHSMEEAEGKLLESIEEASGASSAGGVLSAAKAALRHEQARAMYGFEQDLEG